VQGLLFVCDITNSTLKAAFLITASSTERSNLYLKLFKLVFGSVSLFAAENEQMLKVIFVLMI